MPERSGLNIATVGGEGAAPILHWDQFNQTLGTIYQRDINNLKSIQAEYGKLSMQMGELGEKIRPADMANFKGNYDKFRQAGLMLESSKVRNNIHERAYWEDQMRKAYFDNQSLAQQSADATKFKTDVWKNVAEHPENYYDYDTLKEKDALYDSLPVSELNKRGLNTQVPWMHPADLYDKSEKQNFIYGKTKTSERREPIVDPKTGKTTSYNVYTQEYSERTPSEIANRTAQFIKGVWSESQYAKQKFEYLKQNNPEQIQQSIEKAQAIIDAHGGGYKLGTGYVDYEAAVNINESQPHDVGTRRVEPDKDWEDYKRDQEKLQEHKYRLGEIGAQSAATLEREKSFYKFKQDNGLDFSGQEMYQAALDPNGKFEWKKGNQTRTGTGRDLLSSRMSDIIAKTAKNIDYVVLDRKSILDPASRRRIVDKLFGFNAKSKQLYDLGPAAYLPDSQKIDYFLKYLRQPTDNGGLGINMTEDDLNQANPIIINQDKGTKELINLSTTNYDQFIAQLQQLLMQDKPVRDVDDDGGDYMQMLINNQRPSFIQ